MTEALLDLLACPACRAPYDRRAMQADALTCGVCHLRTPVVGGVPRFVQEPDTKDARRTQASFGYEWTHFHDPEPSGSVTFSDYFAGFDLDSLRNALVLDGGCGMGRHARFIATHARRVVALDFSAAIDQAVRNTAHLGNVECVQGDLTRLPLRDQVFDFVYSLGVVHHIADTEGALRGLVAKLKPGGRLRVYVYWKRSGLVGAVLSLVAGARIITTRLPFPLLRALCWALSVVLFGCVALPYKAAVALGIRNLDSWPLFVYSKHPFTVLYNDQFDRFSAPIEKRYSPDEVRRLLESVGLTNISVQSCYGWVADGVKPEDTPQAP